MSKFFLSANDSLIIHIESGYLYQYRITDISTFSLIKILPTMSEQEMLQSIIGKLRCPSNDGKPWVYLLSLG